MATTTDCPHDATVSHPWGVRVTLCLCCKEAVTLIETEETR